MNVPETGHPLLLSRTLLNPAKEVMNRHRGEHCLKQFANLGANAVKLSMFEKI